MTHPFAPDSASCLLTQLGFETPTEIQRQAMSILEAGTSLLALAPTGSGKTLAFLLPLMKRIRSELPETQLLVLAPTRELGTQIAQVAENIARVCDTGRPLLVRTAFGGQRIETQKMEIRKRPSIVVATPGRALELLEQEILCLDHLAALVLDEADLMVGMGFEPQVSRICTFLPARVQTALFSATESVFRSDLEGKLLHGAARIDVRPGTGSASPCSEPGAPVRHETLVVRPEQDKAGRLMALLREIAPRVETGIIFCQTRETVHSLSAMLRAKGFSAEALSGELGQVERATILRRFKAGGVQYLVATNLASRGIDVKGLSVVVNFDLPSTLEEYVHRSGRSGRAGEEGWTLSLCSAKSVGFLQALLAADGIVPKAYQPLASPAEEEVRKLPIPSRSFRRIHLNRGRSSKLRPGDILGALTKDLGLAREEVGSIFIFDHFTHVEVEESHATDIVAQLSRKRIKNLTVRATFAAEFAPVH